MRSRVVYKYTCQCCGALYFVQTRRYLHTRISEHMGVSPLTGKKLATTSISSIQAHIHHTHHTISPNDFSIILSCHSSSNFELLIQESLLISKFKATSTRIRIFLKTQVSYGLAFRPHVNVETVIENGTFRRWSPKWDFSKTPFPCSRVDVDFFKNG